MSLAWFRRCLVVLGLAGVLTLSGCAQCWDDTVIPFAAKGPDASKVLTNCRLAASLPQKDQEALLEELRNDFEQEQDPETRFNLVCLVLQSNRSRQDRVRARDLLREYQAQVDSQEDLAALAWWLECLISRNLATEQKLDEERRRAETLAGKLKALEDIEKIIRKREGEGLTPPLE